MARRRRSSPAEDLMDLIAMLPWWAGVVLAAASYVLLHAVATRPLPVVTHAEQIGQATTATIWHGLAMGGQYLLPMLCLAGAALSSMRRRQRRALLEEATSSNAAEALQGMSWQQFELLVGEGFRQQGFAAKERGGNGADGGIDLILTRGGETFLVQCKHWKAFKVGVAVVRELYGLMAAHGAAGGFVVASGKFTREAVAFAEGRNIRLVDGPALLKLLQNARRPAAGAEPVTRASSALQAVPTAASAPDAGSAPHPRAPVVSQIPDCPRCGQRMVWRQAKRGRAAGTAFWGCSAYVSGCRGTRDVAAG